MHTTFDFEMEDTIVEHPVEVIEVHVATELLDKFLVADHQVWTLGEVAAFPCEPIPILSKEVSVDSSNDPVTKVFITIIWESREKWQRMNDPIVQQKLQMKFDEAFPYLHKIVRIDQPETSFVKRVSRFARH